MKLMRGNDLIAEAHLIEWIESEQGWKVDNTIYVDTLREMTVDIPLVVPQSITMRQCRLQLLATGKLNLVAAAIATLPSPQKEAAEIEWEYGAVVLRDSPLITQLAPVLGWNTPEEIDEQFRQAALL